MHDSQATQQASRDHQMHEQGADRSQNAAQDHRFEQPLPRQVALVVAPP